MDEGKKQQLIEELKTSHKEINSSDVSMKAWEQIKKLEKLSILRDDNNFKKYEDFF